MAAGIKYEGYEIKPWGLAEIERLAPTFTNIHNDLSESDLSIFKKFKDDKELKEDDAFEVLGSLTPIILKIIPHVRALIKESVRNITDKKLNDMGLDTITAFVLIIIKQNVNYLKNFFGPLQDAAKDVTAD